MNKIKLLTRLQTFFNADAKEKKKKAEQMKGVIKKLKAKENKIKKMLDECQDENMKKALQLEVDVIEAQIEKGRSALEDL